MVILLVALEDILLCLESRLTVIIPQYFDDYFSVL